MSDIRERLTQLACSGNLYAKHLLQSCRNKQMSDDELTQSIREFKHETKSPTSHICKFIENELCYLLEDALRRATNDEFDVEMYSSVTRGLTEMIECIYEQEGNSRQRMVINVEGNCLYGEVLPLQEFLRCLPDVDVESVVFSSGGKQYLVFDFPLHVELTSHQGRLRIEAFINSASARFMVSHILLSENGDICYEGVQEIESLLDEIGSEMNVRDLDIMRSGVVLVGRRRMGEIAELTRPIILDDSFTLSGSLTDRLEHLKEIVDLV